MAAHATGADGASVAPARFGPVTTRLLVVGLDAVEAPLLERLCDAGRLPTLAALRRSAVTARLRPACMDLLPGAIWQDLGTGVSVGRHGDYYPQRIHTGEAVPRSIDAHQHADRYWWGRAGRAGARVAVVDQPLVPAIRSLPVTLVSEWHVHDQLWGRGSHPAELLADLEARHGRRPLDRCDTAHDRTPAGYERWLDHLLRELRVKADMALDLLERDTWDVFDIAFSDGHCAGHQLWDPPAGHPRLEGAVDEVCAALDAAVGRLMEASGDAVTVLFTSHGMGPYIGGPQLLPVVLARMGMGDPRRLPPWIRPLLPVGAYQRLAARFPRAGRSLGARLGQRGFHRPGTIAMEVANNRVGAIRLNVVGREPTGAVAPSDVGTVLAAIEAELLALRHPDLGEPIVASVVRPAEAYGPDHHPDLPDLLVVFRRDLGPLVGCVGPRSGRVEAGFRRADYPRTGDHTDASRLWVTAPGVPPRDLGEADALDLAPTLLALLGLPPGPEMEGRPMEGVLAAVSAWDRGR